MYWAALISLSFRSSNELPRFDIPHLDKLVHFCFFFGLSFLLGRALIHLRPRWSLQRIGLCAILFGLAYGVVDEYIQSFVPGRVPDFYDYLFDIFGSLAGVGFLRPYLKIRSSFYNEA